ncbi:MAG: cyclophane-forming radical SAM/SPASM peptide maturase GrrM/OscB [Methyloceanibacter sp.]
MEPISLLILQPTPFCNIDCKYCYLPSRDRHHLMKEEVLTAIFEKVFTSGRLSQELSVVWHVGEPLAAPISFYEQAFALAERMRPPGTVLKHGFQTNGTLITDEWCRFIKRANISIGVSVDGPRALHDANRVTRSHTGTFDKVMQAIRLLQDHDIDFNVISVVTRTTLHFPDELFDFYVSNGIRKVAFNIEEIEGAHATTSLGGAEIDGLFRRFAERLFRLYQQSDKIEWVREFDNVLRRAGSFNAGPIRNTQVIPFSIVSVDHTGNFGTFAPEILGMKDERYGDFVLGNFLHDDFESVAATDKFKRIAGDINEGVELCRRSCEYFSVCGGGAPSNKLYENGTFASSETMYCRLTRKILFDAAADVYREQAGRRRPAV